MSQRHPDNLLEKMTKKDLRPRPCGEGPQVQALAAGSRRPIYPVTVRYRGFWELPTWDRFQIPQPGSVCQVIVGPSVAAPKSAEPAELDRVRGELEKTLGD